MNREQWLTALGDSIADDLIQPHANLMNLEAPPVRFSVGFPPRSKGGKKTAGFCCARSASADQHNEIFIVPSLDDSLEIAAIIAHELIHAYLDNEDGHKGRFVTLAKSIGLMSPFTQSIPNDELTAALQDYISVLGPIPAASLALASVGKKQKPRNLSVVCSYCDFRFRTSRKQIDRIQQNAPCPVCSHTHTLKEDT